jgi:hypothetical protein
MELAHFYQRNQLHRFTGHPNFRHFEFAIWLHTVARSLISVFVPIFLFQSGYSIVAIIIFYLAFNAIDVPLNFVVARVMRAIGARKTLMLGTLFTVAFFVLLGALPLAWWSLLILAFLEAAYDTFFWISHIYIFMEASREEANTAGTVGALEAIKRLAGIIGPIVGAVIVVMFGQSSLVLASIAVFALSVIPLFKLRHLTDVPVGRTPSIREFFASRREKQDYSAMALWGIHSFIEGILWPLFIFTVFGTIGSVALVPAIVSLGTALFSYGAGRLTKRYGVRMVVVGSAVVACMWVLRLTLLDPALYYASALIVGAFSLLVAIPIDVRIVSRALTSGSLAAATYRNAAAMVLRIPLCVVLIIVTNVFNFGFALAAVSLLGIIASITLNNKKDPLM